MPQSKVLNQDCLEAMREMPDGAFDLAIVDVPYGINASQMSLGEGGGLYRQPKTYKRGNWDLDAPPLEYFLELRRVSVNQIIWGANHFISRMPFDSSAWIFWDKNNGGSDFADGELAWTSFKKPARKFVYTWSGFIQGNMAKKESRIHPTQKPIQLYKWLLQNYAKPGQTILDTYLGSGSSRIAAYDLGFDFTGYELDCDYYEAQEKRFQDHVKQPKLFTAPAPVVEQAGLSF